MVIMGSQNLAQAEERPQDPLGAILHGLGNIADGITKEVGGVIEAVIHKGPERQTRQSNWLYDLFILLQQLNEMFSKKPPVEEDESTPDDSVTKEPATDDCQCGLANRVTKIVGGSEAEENEYPWQVGLALSGSSRPFCGGSLISSKEVLTAGHCTRQISKMYVLLGEHNWKDITGSERRVEVCNVANHQNYEKVAYDYSVLTLCEEVEFNQAISPVCLPTEEGKGSKYENVAAVVSGWGTLHSNGGQPQVLMEAEVTTMKNTVCCNQYAYECNLISDQMLCAAGPGRDSCQGDSGGPLIHQEDAGHFTQIGVVSWGFGCSKNEYPGVYSRVSNQLSWIKEKITGKTCSIPPS